MGNPYHIKARLLRVPGTIATVVNGYHVSGDAFDGVEGTLPPPAPPSLTGKVTKLYDYSDIVKQTLETAEFWYDKLGSGAKFIGGFVAWRANPGRRFR